MTESERLAALARLKADFKRDLLAVLAKYHAEIEADCTAEYFGDVEMVAMLQHPEFGYAEIKFSRWLDERTLA